MRIDLIPAGDSPPDSLNVLIEVPLGGEPVKYEFDKASGALFVDRFLHTPMRYPANYGFVPHTLGEDGDPLDALVVALSPVVAGAVVKCRPIAAGSLTIRCWIRAVRGRCSVSATIRRRSIPSGGTRPSRCGAVW